MIITIEISDHYIEILSEGVSLRRILNNAVDCANGNTDPIRVGYVNDELEPMISALDHLHYQVRAYLWRNR